MRVLIKIAILFYVIIIMVTGLLGVVLMAHLVDLQGYQKVLAFVYNDPKAGMITGVVIVAIMVISIVLARIIYGRQEQERIITFDNPLGRVTISLSAIEDLVRRMAVRAPQIKEIRPEVSSTKKGIKVDIRLVLRSDVNISELTADLQEMIKRRIQDVIGREERVMVRVHVIKIATDIIIPGKKGMDDEEIEPPLHFHGYRA
ncbi:MAG: alkaline shock response membrane anchor protein AmaP [Candidatus Omnitrophica bacterium]|nr:alkaline shock response membrane anchor protein AmaP [Candidatus Omnitrophota bacterium]